MIEARKEIKSIIETFSKKKKFSDMNTRKLMDLFENAALDFPEGKKSDAAFTARIHEIRKEIGHAAPAGRTPFIFQRPALAAGIAAVIIAIFGFGIRLAFYSGPSSESAALAVDGRVTLLRDGANLDLSPKSRVIQGDIIVSGKNSHADMDFGGLVRMRLDENSTVTLENISLGSERAITLSVDRGGAYVHVMKLANGDDVRVNTPVSVGLVRGTLFGVKYADGKARYEVYEGKVSVSSKVQGAAVQDAPAGQADGVVLGRGSWARIRSAGIIHAAGRIDSAELSMSAAVLDFMIDMGRVDSDFTVMPVNFAVTPPEASISVDGVGAGHGMTYLPRGRHRIEVRAEGYRGFTADITVKNPMQVIPVMLERGKTTLAVWSSHLQSSHIFYNSNRNNLITVDDQGLVAITDFKSVKWSLDFDKNLSGPPHEADGVLYISFADGTLALCDYNNGKVIWKKTLDGAVPGNRGMVHSGSNIFAVTEKGTLYKIDRTGNVAWQFSLRSPIKVQPVCRGNTVYVALKKGWILGIHSETGIEKRKVFLDDEIGSMTLSNDALYISTLSGNVYNYNCGNDSIEWTMSTPVKGLSSIAVDDKSVYVFYNTGYLVRLNLSGRTLWERDLGTKIFLSPARDGRSFYFTGRNNLFVVSRETGEVQWSVVVPSVLTDTVALSKNKMFIVSSSKGLMVLNKF